MKYVFGLIVLAVLMVSGLFLVQEEKDKAFIEPLVKKEINQRVVPFSGVASDPEEFFIKLDEVERVPVEEVPLLYPDNEYMQRAVEYLAITKGWEIAELTRLSSIHVLMEIETAVACDAYGDGSRGVTFNGQFCDELDYESAVRLHPYYEYPIATLEQVALYDGTAAAVLARRLGTENLQKSLEFAMRSSALTGKVGPLLAYQSQLLDAVSQSQPVPVRLETAIRRGHPLAVQLYAIDAVVVTLDDSIPPLEAEWLKLASTEIRKAVEIRSKAFSKMLSELQRSLKPGGAA